MSVARPRVWRPVIQEAKHIWRLFIGDEVQVVKKGPDEGSKGKVIALLRDEKKPELIVEGLNMVRGDELHDELYDHDQPCSSYSYLLWNLHRERRRSSLE